MNGIDTALKRAYAGAGDFIKIRDFLKTAYYSFGKPTNWGMERWNWARYHPSMFSGDAASNIAYFESQVTLWEDSGRIVAVLNTEQPSPTGEAWIQRLPQADSLLDRILDQAEAAMANPADGLLRLAVYDHDETLKAAALRRGYVRENDEDYWSQISMDSEKPVSLPPGFRIRSMDESDSRLDFRCRAMGLGFNHPDPSEWSTPAQFAQVQLAPDYSPTRDFVVEAPDGDYVSLCIVWYDDINRFGVFEPVCTQPAYRKLGLGRAVMQAGLNCLYRLGARTAYVGSGQEFYAALGFQRAYRSSFWKKYCR